MNTLPPLPLDPTGDFALLPINGFGQECAAVCARLLIQNGFAKSVCSTSTPHARASVNGPCLYNLDLNITRVITNCGGKPFYIQRNEKMIIVALFKDKTCLIGTLDGLYTFYPQPLMALGSDPVSGLKAISNSEWDALYSALSIQYNLAHKGNLSLPWVSWTDLDTTAQARTNLLPLVDALFAIFPQPKNMPTTRSRFNVTPIKPSVKILINARRLTVTGVSEVDVILPKMMEDQNPGWGAPLKKSIKALFSSKDLVDPTHQIKQSATENGVVAQPLLSHTVVFRTDISAHERFEAAAYIPPEVFA